MGVDYSGYFGFGIQVKKKEFPEDSEYHEDFIYYLDDLTTENKQFGYFEVGEGSYTGNEDEIYIYVENPFSEGYDVSAKAKLLIEFLEANEIEYIDKPDIVGGLRVY